VAGAPPIYLGSILSLLDVLQTPCLEGACDAQRVQRGEHGAQGRAEATIVPQLRELDGGDQQAAEFSLAHLLPDGKVPAIDLGTEIPAVDVPVWFVG
jgi:hypothetical protein